MGQAFPAESDMPIPPEERLVIARDPKTPSKQLTGLERDPSPKVRAAVAANPSTPSRVLLRMAWEPSLRETVAVNPSLRLKEARWILANYPQTKVLLARNPHLPPEFHKELGRSSTTWKVYAAADHTPPGVLNWIVDSPKGEGFLAAVAANPNCPTATLRNLAKSQRVDVVLGVAKNPSTPPEMLERLVTHRDVKVQAAVRDNPNADEHVAAAAAFMSLPDLN